MSTPTIDNRLLYPDSQPEVAENFNRIMAIIDELDGGSSATLYTVTFDGNGAVGTPTQIVAEGEKAVEPDDPDRGDDYTFNGWWNPYSDSEEYFDFDTEINENIYLRASWEYIGENEEE